MRASVTGNKCYNSVGGSETETEGRERAVEGGVPSPKEAREG